MLNFELIAKRTKIINDFLTNFLIWRSMKTKHFLHRNMVVERTFLSFFLQWWSDRNLTLTTSFWTHSSNMHLFRTTSFLVGKNGSTFEFPFWRHDKWRHNLVDLFLQWNKFKFDLSINSKGDRFHVWCTVSAVENTIVLRLSDRCGELRKVVAPEVV